MRNPYLVLNIKQDATNEEIEFARRYQLKLQCGVDANKKNEKGEYLQEIIDKAANDLLDSEKRKAIDEELSNKPLVVYNSTYLPPVQTVLTKINQELISELQNVKLEKTSCDSDKKVKVKNLYIFVLENHYIGYSKVKRNFLTGTNKFIEYFTGKKIVEELNWNPWDCAKIFKANGFLTMASPAYQMLPNAAIQNGRVTDSFLRQIHPILQKVTSNNLEEIDFMFQQEHENEKVKKK